MSNPFYLIGLVLIIAATVLASMALGFWLGVTAPCG